MITNWQEQYQNLKRTLPYTELWKFSPLEDFINLEENIKEDLSLIVKPSTKMLPTFMQSDFLYFNGKQWETSSTDLMIENSLPIDLEEKFQHELSLKQFINQDVPYSWYKTQSSSQVLKLEDKKNLIIFIPHLSKQLILPELYLEYSKDHPLNIYEVHYSVEANVKPEFKTLSSVKLLNEGEISYHRFFLQENLSSVHWFQVINNFSFKCFFWKQKEQYHKEYVNIRNHKENATTVFKLIANLNKDSHVDLTTHINHGKKETHSSQVFKCILADQAQASLTGKIYIDKNCPQSQAQFKSKHTLLSSKARVFSQPQLEIHTDDVECNHGSSTGALQEEELFYLSSRGLHPKVAKKMLLRAFMMDEIHALPMDEQQEFFKDFIL